MQNGDDGKPARKCQRLVRKLRDCGRSGDARYDSLSISLWTEDCHTYPMDAIWCRGLEEVQVEREEVIENTFSGDMENVEDLDRLFG